MIKFSEDEWIINHDSENYKRMKIEDGKLLNVLINSFVMLYNYDEHLINNSPYILDSNGNTNDQIGTKHHVGERSIVFRFGYYLQKQLEKSEYKNYNVDCEYNRNGENAKTLPSFPKGVYPDLIIHKRGNNKNNLLIVEFKTYWNSDTQHDIEKINEFINPDGEYKYKYGMSVLIDEDNPVIEVVDYSNRS